MKVCFFLNLFVEKLEEESKNVIDKIFMVYQMILYMPRLYIYNALQNRLTSGLFLLINVVSLWR